MSDSESEAGDGRDGPEKTLASPDDLIPLVACCCFIEACYTDWPECCGFRVKFEGCCFSCQQMCCKPACSFCGEHLPHQTSPAGRARGAASPTPHVARSRVLVLLDRPLTATPAHPPPPPPPQARSTPSCARTRTRAASSSRARASASNPTTASSPTASASAATTDAPCRRAASTYVPRVFMQLYQSVHTARPTAPRTCSPPPRKGDSSG